MATHSEMVNILVDDEHIAGTFLSPPEKMPGVLFVHGWGGSQQWTVGADWVVSQVVSRPHVAALFLGDEPEIWGVPYGEMCQLAEYLKAAYERIRDSETRRLGDSEKGEKEAKKIVKTPVLPAETPGYAAHREMAAQRRHNVLLAAGYCSGWIDIVKTQPPNTALVARIQKAGECRDQRACVQGACR